MTAKKSSSCISQGESLYHPIAEFQPSITSSCPSYMKGENITFPVISILVHSDTDGGFWIKVPQLPGCYSQAENEDDIYDNILESINGYLSSFDSDDLDKPPYDVGKFIPWISYE